MTNNWHKIKSAIFWNSIYSEIEENRKDRITIVKVYLKNEKVCLLSMSVEELSDSLSSFKNIDSDDSSLAMSCCEILNSNKDWEMILVEFVLTTQEESLGWSFVGINREQFISGILDVVSNHPLTNT